MSTTRLPLAASNAGAFANESDMARAWRDGRFTSIEELRLFLDELVQKYGKAGSGIGAIASRIVALLDSAVAAGPILERAPDGSTVQGLLDYWYDALYRRMIEQAREDGRFTSSR